MPTDAISDPVLRFDGVWKTYPQASGVELHAVRDVRLDVAAGSRTAIVGRSGSGKSTLLHLGAGIDAPTRGRVELLGRDLAALPERERTLARRHDVGLVFQFFHLLPHLTVFDNVLLPARIAGDPERAARARAEELLARVDLDGRGEERAEHLSGGEMQRVAICRALLRRPQVLLADEPTGNLDDRSGRGVMELLLDLTAAEGRTLVYVTHSREMAAMADRRLSMHSGRLDEGAPA